MGTILSSTLLENSQQADGRRSVRYRYVVQDALSDQHEIIVDRGLVEPGFDVDADRIAREQTVLDQLAEQEKAVFRSELESGINPFQTRSLRHHTRGQMLQMILRMFLSQKLPLTVLAMGAAFVDRVTDTEMKAVLGIDDAKVTEIRNSVNKFKQHKTDWDAYVPPLPEAN